MKNITVIGAGAFGTALAIYNHSIGHRVRVWSFEKDLPDTVRQAGENTPYLPGVKVSPDIEFTSDMQHALSEADLVILVAPSAFTRATVSAARQYIPADALLVSATKGIENGTLYLMSDILEEVIPEAKNRITYISGPTFAREIAQGMPADISCAAHDINVARAVQDILHSPRLRVYAASDVVSVELGGSLKNVIAVAAGASDGMGLGLSARASLITRGLAEMTRLAVALGGDPISLSGLVGVGDLILTCTGDLSRNRTLGMRLANGEKASDILASQKAVAEGYVTAASVHDLAQKYNVDMPISEMVYQVCYNNLDIKEAAKALMTREKKDEFIGIKFCPVSNNNG